jgi:hypothetical protein
LKKSAIFGGFTEKSMQLILSKKKKAAKQRSVTTKYRARFEVESEGRKQTLAILGSRCCAEAAASMVCSVEAEADAITVHTQNTAPNSQRVRYRL